MMLHRHFEAEKNKNMTTLQDLTPAAREKKEEFVSEVFPPEEPAEASRKRGRPRKSE